MFGIAHDYSFIYALMLINAKQLATPALFLYSAIAGPFEIITLFIACEYLRLIHIICMPLRIQIEC